MAFFCTEASLVCGTMCLSLMYVYQASFGIKYKQNKIKPLELQNSLYCFSLGIFVLKISACLTQSLCISLFEALIIVSFGFLLLFALLQRLPD